MSTNHHGRQLAGDPGYSPRSRTEPSAPGRPLQRRPASLAPLDLPGLAVLRRLEAKLRQAGATLPAPTATSTVEGAVITGLCIALCLVEAETNIAERDAELAAMSATMPPAERQAWELHRANLREQINRAVQYSGQHQVDAAGTRADALPPTGVSSAEVAQLLADLERVGAKAEGEMIGIYSQAGAVIKALLVGLSAEQLS